MRILLDSNLKGVPIQDLSFQYGTSGTIIEMVLRNRGIVVMKDEPENNQLFISS